ncbi:uncharacterized protein SCHCODRAFT_02620141 [Schizophyllum commune H4-8]|nr:uncharacterized protein SCHCODRAFT_02620141 [Schizophyllum commune H4-8]KAI5895697.1 hypothetical protein SCHCODRAFT_02620141 [Schizophyllum commune H4-8]
MGSEDISSVAAESLLSRYAGVANLSVHRSGRVLSHNDVALLKENIPLLEEELSRDSESPESSAQLFNASALTDLLALHKALISPVRRLYTEILSEIFLLAIPDGWLEELCGTVIHPCTQVCHVWREVALGTPSLWSTICINIDSGALVELSKGFFVLLGSPSESEVELPSDVEVDSEADDEGSGGDAYDVAGDDNGGSAGRDEGPSDDGVHESPEETAHDDLEASSEVASREDDDTAGQSSRMCEEDEEEPDNWEWITNIYLERSARVPLTIEYHVGMEYSGPTFWEDASWLLLLQHPERWKHVTITSPLNLFRRFEPPPPFALLEYLELRLYEHADEESQPLQFFSNAPCLRNLITTTHTLPYHYADPKDVLPPSWKSLVEVRMGEYHFDYGDDACTIANTSVIHQHCAATLQECSIWAHEPAQRSYSPSLHSKDYPVLRALEMTDFGMEFSELIRSAPKLESVRMRADPGYYGLTLHHLTQMLSRMTCANLTSLFLVCVQAMPQDVIECLKAAPTLGELDIMEWETCDYGGYGDYDMIISVEVLHALTRSDERPASLSMLPSLERLALNAPVMPELHSSDERQMVQAVLDMVHSRVRPREAEGLRALQQFHSTIKAIERVTVEYVRQHKNDAEL